MPNKDQKESLTSLYEAFEEAYGPRSDVSHLQVTFNLASKGCFIRVTAYTASVILNGPDAEQIEIENYNDLDDAHEQRYMPMIEELTDVLTGKNSGFLQQYLPMPGYVISSPEFGKCELTYSITGVKPKHLPDVHEDILGYLCYRIGETLAHSTIATLRLTLNYQPARSERGTFAAKGFRTAPELPAVPKTVRGVNPNHPVPLSPLTSIPQEGSRVKLATGEVVPLPDALKKGIRVQGGEPAPVLPEVKSTGVTTVSARGEGIGLNKAADPIAALQEQMAKLSAESKHLAAEVTNNPHPEVDLKNIPQEKIVPKPSEEDRARDFADFDKKMQEDLKKMAEKASTEKLVPEEDLNPTEIELDDDEPFDFDGNTAKTDK